MVTTSSFADFFAFLTQLMTDHAGLFEAMGERMFRSFATILIAWFGIKSALSAASGSMTSVFHFDRFAELLLTIAFGFGMITYYSHPLPGIGVSFYHLIVDQGQYLANQLDYSVVSDVSGGDSKRSEVSNRVMPWNCSGSLRVARSRPRCSDTRSARDAGEGDGLARSSASNAARSRSSIALMAFARGTFRAGAGRPFSR